MDNNYDSRIDTNAHKEVVREVFGILIEDFKLRRLTHDASKFVSPEKEGYDKFIPMLKETPYASPEYVKVRQQMFDECLKHHYEVNRHHPEHFENGIKDFTIVDLVEYFVDTYSASTRSDTPFSEGLKFNAKKHNLPEEIVMIFENTVREYFGEK